MKCIPLEELTKMWEVDSVIDTTEPGYRVVETAKLHSKYCSQIVSHTVALKLKTIKFDRLERLKWAYYGGKLNGTNILKELKWEPYPLSVLREDIKLYVKGDDDLLKLREEMIPNEEAITFCTSVCWQINSRTSQLRAFIEWHIFKNGGR